MEAMMATKEKLLACVSTSASSARLINSVKTLADTMSAKWYAVYVEDLNVLSKSEEEHNRAIDCLRRAEKEGAETFILNGSNIAAAIMYFARQHQVTKIITGKPTRSLWKSVFLKSTVDRLVRISSDVDVCVITGTAEGQGKPAYVFRPDRSPLSDYVAGLILLILANILSFLMYPAFHFSNLIMVYLLGVMLTATSCGRGPAILVSCLSVLSFDFFFTPPRFSLTVEDAQDIVTFIVMLSVALVISQLASRMREQARAAYYQERQAAAMHGLSHRLVSTRGTEKILAVALQYMAEIFNCRVLAMLPDAGGKLHVVSGDPAEVFGKDIRKKVEMARLAFDSGRIIGGGPENATPSDLLYVPLQSVDATLGLLVLRPGEPGRFTLKDQWQLLESLSKQVALSLAVERLCGTRERDREKL